MIKTAIGAPAPPPESLVRVVVRDQPSFVRAMEVARAKLPIEIVSVTIEELYDDYVRGTKPCDIMLALTDWLPELRESGRLSPIKANPELLVRHGEGDFHPSLMSLCQWRGNGSSPREEDAAMEGVGSFEGNTPPPSSHSLRLPQRHLLPKEEDCQLQSPSPGEGVARYEPGAGIVPSSGLSSVHPPHPNPLPLGSGGEGVLNSSPREGEVATRPAATEGVNSCEEATLTRFAGSPTSPCKQGEVARDLPPPRGGGGFEGATATEKTGAGISTFPQASAGEVSMGRHLAAVPFHVGPEVFHYRRDLFEDPAEQAAFLARFDRELQPPQTWSEFVEVGQHFTRPGLWGCCFGAYPDGHNNVYDFLIHLWTRGGSLDRLDSPAAIEALTFYRDLVTTYQIASPECLQLNSIQSGGYYAQGHVAMMWNWAGFATVAETSSIAGKNAITVIPRGNGPEGMHSSLNVFWALVKMNDDSDVVDRVFGGLTSTLMDITVGLTGNCAARRSTWDNVEMQQRFPYYAILEEAYNGARTLPAHPRWAEANHEISHAVERVMQTGEDVAAVLAECETKVRTILI